MRGGETSLNFIMLGARVNLHQYLIHHHKSRSFHFGFAFNSHFGKDLVVEN